MNASERVALIDMDGTLCDYNKSLEDKLIALAHPSEFLRDSTPNLHEDKPWLQVRRALIRSQPGFWRNLEPIPAGFAVVSKFLELDFRLMVLTKGPYTASSAWTEKVEWCKAHLPEAEITVTQDKGLVYGRVLFDDWPEYMNRWLQWRPRGLGIMLDQPWNQGYYHCNVFRYRPNLEGKEWQEQDRALVQALREARSR